MKLQIPILWNTLRNGAFPTEQIKEISDDIEITIDTVSVFKQKVTVTMELADEDNPLVVAYELGGYIALLNVNRLL
jgi:hypothetical protein